VHTKKRGNLTSRELHGHEDFDERPRIVWKEENWVCRQKRLDEKRQIRKKPTKSSSYCASLWCRGSRIDDVGGDVRALRGAECGASSSARVRGVVGRDGGSRSGFVGEGGLGED
jgi:hypothetical protein